MRDYLENSIGLTAFVLLEGKGAFDIDADTKWVDAWGSYCSVIRPYEVSIREIHLRANKLEVNFDSTGRAVPESWESLVASGTYSPGLFAVEYFEVQLNDGGKLRFVLVNDRWRKTE